MVSRRDRNVFFNSDDNNNNTNNHQHPKRPPGTYLLFPSRAGGVVIDNPILTTAQCPPAPLLHLLITPSRLLSRDRSAEKYAVINIAQPPPCGRTTETYHKIRPSIPLNPLVTETCDNISVSKHRSTPS
ncbi:unnamed protein product [Ectocarpus sp. 12 AP-2014]